MNQPTATAPIVLENLFAIAKFQADLPWQPFRKGIDIYSLGQNSATGLHTALLRYQPGATVPPHHHPATEQILVLMGSQQDERGVYSAGTLVINPPGSGHQVTSPQGCIVLVTWEQPVEFAD